MSDDVFVGSEQQLPILISHLNLQQIGDNSQRQACHCTLFLSSQLCLFLWNRGT